MKKFRLLSLALSLVIGVSCSTTAMAAVSPSVSSDTAKPITVAQGSSYTVKFTVHGTHENPGITVGNGSVLQTQLLKKLKDTSGNDIYFVKIKAIGKVGEKTSVYTKLPGQSPAKQFPVTVGKPVSTAANTPVQITDETILSANKGTMEYSFHGRPNTAYMLTIQFGSGNSKATVIGTKTSDTKGIATWSWKVGSNANSGKHMATVTGGGQTCHFYLVMI